MADFGSPNVKDLKGLSTADGVLAAGCVAVLPKTLGAVVEIGG